MYIVRQFLYVLGKGERYIMMKEFSMHIMDIVENSIVAGADRISIYISEDEKENRFRFSVVDNGRGMPKDFVDKIRDPFTTSRTTRKVGLGIPMLEQTCIQCGGHLDIESRVGEGTTITAVMEYNHIDRPPLGDMAKSLYLMVLMNQRIIFFYNHKVNKNEFEFDMKEVREIIGDLPLDTPEISSWLKESIYSGIEELYLL